MQSGADEEQLRVSTLELFFDLVFVFTLTQLTSVLVHDPTGEGLLQVALMLTAIWWMYGAFLWLTNAIPAERTLRQLFLLGGMATFFVIALAIPEAFSGDGVAFAGAYLVVVCLHAGLYVGAAGRPTFAAVLEFARFNAIAAILILAAAIVGGDRWEYVLWMLGVAVIGAAPWLIRPGDPIKPSHFVERHGLVVIVALGESVVAVGIGAADHALTIEMIAVAVLGLMLSASLWWTYFGGDEEEAERAMAAAPVHQRGMLALIGYFYCHLLILAGIVAIAAALEQAIGHAFDRLDLARALFLGGGTAAFFVGDVLFCRTLGIGHSTLRLLAAGLALATVPLGTVAAVAQLAALVVAVIICLVAERSRQPAPAPAAGIPD